MYPQCPATASQVSGTEQRFQPSRGQTKHGMVTMPLLAVHPRVIHGVPHRGIAGRAPFAPDAAGAF